MLTIMFLYIIQPWVNTLPRRRVSDWNIQVSTKQYTAYKFKYFIIITRGYPTMVCHITLFIQDHRNVTMCVLCRKMGCFLYDFTYHTAISLACKQNTVQNLQLCTCTYMYNLQTGLGWQAAKLEGHALFHNSTSLLGTSLLVYFWAEKP